MSLYFTHFLYISFSLSKFLIFLFEFFIFYYLVFFYIDCFTWIQIQKIHVTIKKYNAKFPNKIVAKNNTNNFFKIFVVFI